jgi:putative FmdB family regulatory protein
MSPGGVHRKAGNMPIYEFRCQSCRRRTSLFVRTITAQPAGGACEHCGSADITRIFSRVAVLKGDDLADFGESSLADVDESDPRTMAKWVRKMSRQMGEPMDAEMEADLERMEAGEMPDGEDGADDGFDDLD